jgi:hypothetical protein
VLRAPTGEASLSGNVSALCLEFLSGCRSSLRRKPLEGVLRHPAHSEPLFSEGPDRIQILAVDILRQEVFEIERHSRRQPELRSCGGERFFIIRVFLSSSRSTVCFFTAPQILGLRCLSPYAVWGVWWSFDAHFHRRGMTNLGAMSSEFRHEGSLISEIMGDKSDEPSGYTPQMSDETAFL